MKIFVGSTIALLLTFGMLIYDAYAEEVEEEEARVERIFSVIEIELDKIDLKQETETDRVATIITKTLIGFGYTEEDSGILITGTKIGKRKKIYNIIVQIHETHDTYQLIYFVDWPDNDKNLFDDEGNQTNI